MKMLGEQLVANTNTVGVEAKKLINSFNKAMGHVRIAQFVFDEADYLLVSKKEVAEIRDIFKAFEIELTNY